MVKKKSLLEDSIFQTLVAAIAATIARLANLRAAGAYKQAHEEIEAHLDDLIGLKYDQIRYLDDQFILDLLTVNEFLDVQRLWYLAALINARGEILAAQGKREEGVENQLRALGFFVEVAFAAAEPISEVDQKIKKIAGDLWTDLPEETLFSLYDLWEQHGSYTQALASLDRLLEITANNPDLVHERRSYLQRLSRKTAEELKKGDLTLDQVSIALNH